MYGDPLQLVLIFSHFADDIFPWYVYAIITLGTAALDTHNEVTFLVIDASAQCSATICPLWKFEKSPILQYIHMNCQ